jgi:hypothetical protein
MQGVRLPLPRRTGEHDGLLVLLLLLLCALGTTQGSAKVGGPEMFYSVDRSGLYQTGGTLNLWQQDPVLGRPFWRLPDWFEADDLRAHVAELFPDGLSLHGW